MHGEKTLLRNKMMQVRRRMHAQEKEAADGRILRHLLELPEYLESGYMLSYVSYGMEADTREILGLSFADKSVAVPRVLCGKTMAFYQITDLGQLAPGRRGILEPEPLEARRFGRNPDEYKGQKVLMLIPGLAFDVRMNRLGYGGGYYDRYLSELETEGLFLIKAGILYGCQLVDAVPVTDLDQGMDILVTDGGVIRHPRKTRRP